MQTALASYTLGNNLENLTFIGTGNFTGTGNVAANVLTGGAGNDTLSASSGNDTLVGGAGNDTMDGGLGNDVFRFGTGFGTDRINGFGASPRPPRPGQARPVGPERVVRDMAIAMAGLDTVVTSGGQRVVLTPTEHGEHRRDRLHLHVLKADRPQVGKLPESPRGE